MNKIKSTCRLAGTGCAVSQTFCHVLPGISMRELKAPLGWFVSVIESINMFN